MGLMALGLNADISLDNQDHKGYKYSNEVHKELEFLIVILTTQSSEYHTD